MSDNLTSADRTIYLQCSFVETDHGFGIELIIAGLDPAKLNDIAQELRALLLENRKRIFGQSAQLVS
jgi:hypothetical protein